MVFTLSCKSDDSASEAALKKYEAQLDSVMKSVDELQKKLDFENELAEINWKIRKHERDSINRKDTHP